MYCRYTDKLNTRQRPSQTPTTGLSTGMLPKIHVTSRNNSSAFKALYNNAWREMTKLDINQSIKGVK